MTDYHHVASPTLLFVALCAALPASATAQLPTGQLVRSSWTESSLPGPGGLQFVDPATGVTTPVTGFPAS